jgi:ribosomal protein S19
MTRRVCVFLPSMIARVISVLNNIGFAKASISALVIGFYLLITAI